MITYLLTYLLSGVQFTGKIIFIVAQSLKRKF